MRALVIISAFLCLSLPAKAQPAPAATPDPASINLRKYIFTYVSVLDPNIAEDVFGKRISDRFVVIQVTITNKNSNFQFLIHDVSLDLTNVFGQRVTANLARVANSLDDCECTQTCFQNTRPFDSQTRQAIAETEQVRSTRLASCRVKCLSDCRSELKFELSSLELSLVRGVAEKGQAQDKRNKLLRHLEGIGTIAAGLIGIAGFGPSYGDAVAAYNGGVLAAYRHVYPDFTINQMNRLSDSAYRSNTLIPKEQAKVIVAFIPQAIFLTPDQRKAFRKDPTSLYPDLNNDNADTSRKVPCGNGKECNPVDFRRTVALIDGNFVVELKNLPLTLTGVHIEPNEALNFMRANPVVKGYLAGQFLEGSNIALVNAPSGVQVAADSSATPEEGKLFFVITANAPIDPGTPLNFRVFNTQNAQTFSQPASYTIPVPTLTAPEEELQGTVGGADVSLKLEGTNLFRDGVTSLEIEKNSGITATKVEVKENGDGAGVLKATLKMTAAKEGSFSLRAINAKTVVSNPIRIVVKPKS